MAGRLEELAEFHTARGDLELARKLFERSLEIWEGRTDPPIRMAGSLKGLASVAATDGDLNRAVNLYRRALRIQEEGSSPDHPQVAELLSGLAAALLRLGEGTEALQASLRAETIARKHFQLTARGLSETEALAYASSRTSGLNLGPFHAEKQARRAGSGGGLEQCHPFQGFDLRRDGRAPPGFETNR